MNLNKIYCQVITNIDPFWNIDQGRFSQLKALVKLLRNYLPGPSTNPDNLLLILWYGLISPVRGWVYICNVECDILGIDCTCD